MSDRTCGFAVGDIVEVITTDVTREMGMAGNIGVITEVWSSSEVQVDWSRGKPCIDPCYLNHVTPSWLCRWYLEAKSRARKTHELERAWGQERRGLMDRINELVERATEAEAEVGRLRPQPSAYLSALSEAPREDLLSEVARQQARAESAEARLEAVRSKNRGLALALARATKRRIDDALADEVGRDALAIPTPGKGE